MITAAGIKARYEPRDQRRFKVTSPKTERKGKPSRIIPLFPELEPHLLAVSEAAEPGTVHFITKNRKSGRRSDGRECNYRQRFERIIRRAGVEPWPKVFQNLRSSRETELALEHPIQVVTDWLGNTPNVALKHYLQTTESDFQRALKKAVHPDAKSGALAVQNAVQHVHVWNRTDSQTSTPSPCECDTLRIDAQVCSAKGLTLAEVHGNRTHRPHG